MNKLFILIALLSVVLCGDPSCNNPLKYKANTISVDTVSNAVNVALRSLDPTGNSYSWCYNVGQLTSYYDENTGLGPNHDDRSDNPQQYTYTDAQGKAASARTCQLDCLSTFSYTPLFKNEKISGHFFDSCENGRYYNYGVNQNQGCFDPSKLFPFQTDMVMAVCSRFNKCKRTSTSRKLSNTALYGAIHTAKGKNNVGNAFEKMKDWFQNVVGPKFVQFGKMSKAAFIKFANMTREAFDKFGRMTKEKMKEFGKKVKKKFKDLGYNIKANLVKFGKNVKAKFVEFGKNASKNLKKFGRNLATKFKNVGKNLAAKFKNVGKKFKKVGKVFKNLGNKIKNSFKKAKKTLSKLKNLFKKIKNPFKKIKIRNPFKKIKIRNPFKRNRRRR
ncbi:Fmrf [Acrasis kona]|uniref:Fmrf n=1 Tax=Acrasis kona TaxID=1008807 RepID=A0AAW2YJE0_9EUKA